MKTNPLRILLLVGVWVLTGCHPNEPTARPDWKALATDYYGSMSVILDSGSLPAILDKQDVAAAFIGNVCRGVQTPYTEQDSITRISLSVHPSEEEAVMPNQSVVLRYYSAKKQRIYESEPIPYEDEAMLGTLDAGYIPVWKY